MVTLTNSPDATVQKQMAYAGLTGFFEQLLSIDSLKRYKPHPETYNSTCKQLKVAPAQAMLVAAHGWDTAGAQLAGLQAAFIARPGQQTYPLAPAPTLSGLTLPDIARQLIGKPVAVHVPVTRPLGRPDAISAFGGPSNRFLRMRSGRLGRRKPARPTGALR